MTHITYDKVFQKSHNKIGESWQTLSSLSSIKSENLDKHYLVSIFFACKPDNLLISYSLCGNDEPKIFSLCSLVWALLIRKNNDCIIHINVLAVQENETRKRKRWKFFMIYKSILVQTHNLQLIENLGYGIKFSFKFPMSIN